ncbi:MAG: DEAD/DEAH box helicase family protein [Burkholderiaceae bacterium]|nr:DEAD/DEAH box helicase family protein [Burkholderiaceae bacterium]
MAILSELIRHDIPLRTDAVATYAFKPSLESKYRFTSRFGEEVLLHSVDDEKRLIHLPRGLCPVGAVDDRVDGEVVQYPNDPTPRPHQVKLFDETVSFLKQGLSGIVSAYTGWGKTVLGYHAAYVVGRKTIVITTKDDIYKQWIDGAIKFLGLKPHEVGEIRGDKCEVVGTKFVVAMIHSLSKDGKYPDWIAQDFGLVIFDECHRVPADQFSNVVTMFPAKLRLGLSATPERSDGKELLVLAHIGPIRAKTEAQLMVPKVLLFRSAWECPRVLRSDPESGKRRVVRLPHEPGKTAHLEKIIAADPARNHLLADLIYAAYEKNRQLVVFSTLHDHLRAMHRACHQTFGISGRKMGFYIGAQGKAEREAREREKVKPILFTTYTMMGEGTSIDWIDTCLLAMPRANVTQPVGRIRREYPDKGTPVVMDVQDHDSPVFSGYAGSRLKWYKSIGCELKEMN